VANNIADLSGALAKAVGIAGASVVRVEARRRGPSSGVVWREDGAIVTAHHVLERDEEIVVGLPDGAVIQGAVAGRDPSTDLAVVCVPAAGLTTATWVEGDELAVGQLVLGVSRPGRSARAHLGVVSALGEGFRTAMGGRVDRHVETDLPIGIGFSGSALVGPDGRLLGVNNAGLMRATPLALPFATVRRVVEAILEHGSVRRGYLGVGTYPVDLPEDLKIKVRQDAALLVISVQPGSAAAQAGVLLGDALVELDGHALTHPATLLPLLDEHRIGKQAVLRLLRAGEPRDVEIVIGTRGPER
jgi:S1-C subfamily serine protease